MIGMRLRLLPAAALLTIPFAGFGQQSQSGVEIDAMDTSVSPCTNFYQYACGAWRKNNPIPPDQSRWGRFNALNERNQIIAREILEKAAQPSPTRSALDQKIGDYYEACMDAKGIDSKGVDPIKPELDSVSALKTKQQLAGEMVKLQEIGVAVLFRFAAQADPKNAGINIGHFGQGGLGLPDRDYYLKSDPHSVEIRQQYQQHIANMFDLLAKALHATWDSNAKAASVVKFETALATSSMDRVEMRNPDNTYHPMTLKDLPELTPDFDWTAYISDFRPPAVTKINVAQPDYLKGLGALIASSSIDDIKTYLDWHVLHAAATALPEAFVNENFQFYDKTLLGAKEIQPRWKRCESDVDRGLGEALGQKFIEVAFSGPSKARALQMVHEIERAMEQDIKTADWMTDETKKEALVKLADVSNKIGYPDKWRDYSTVIIKRDDYLGDRQRALAFEVRRNLNKIGKPVDKNEWGMTPPTVNAYYSPNQNNINFPAGILQPPFYNPKADDAVNYGAIGVVVGHELTHGFDDQGRRYDGEGNLRDWWTAADAKNFTGRADCVVAEYNTFSPVDGVNLNGKLTLGENAADNGGIHLAYMALMDHLATKILPKEDGFTQQQLFFLGFAQVWCENSTDASGRARAITDPHSPGQFRVNGVVQNMQEFQTAFSCKAGDPMVSKKACRVW